MQAGRLDYHRARMTRRDPSTVAAADPARRARIAFRALARSDFDLLHGWLCEPEVARWYSTGKPTRADVRRKYGPRVSGRSPTRVYVVSVDGRDAGLAQTYRLAEYPEYAHALRAGRGWAGLDYLIGEPELRGRGLAHCIVGAFVAEVVAAVPGASVCASLPARDNVKSVRALARAGFRPLRRVELLPGQVDLLMVRDVRAARAPAAPRPG